MERAEALGWFYMFTRSSPGLQFSKSWALTSHSVTEIVVLPQEFVASIETMGFQTRPCVQLKCKKCGSSFLWNFILATVDFIPFLKVRSYLQKGCSDWRGPQATSDWKTTAEPIQMQTGSICFILIWLILELIKRDMSEHGSELTDFFHILLLRRHLKMHG